MIGGSGSAVCERVDELVGQLIELSELVLDLVFESMLLVGVVSLDLLVDSLPLGGKYVVVLPYEVPLVRPGLLLDPLRYGRVGCGGLGEISECPGGVEPGDGGE